MCFCVSIDVKLHLGVELAVHARAVSHRTRRLFHPLEEHMKAFGFRRFKLQAESADR
jgi:hypothetical protein